MRFYFNLKGTEADNMDITDPDVSYGMQIFEDVPEDQAPEDPVWRPIPHLSGEKHTTGQAQYLDDIPTMISRYMYTQRQMINV